MNTLSRCYDVFASIRHLQLQIDSLLEYTRRECEENAGRVWGCEGGGPDREKAARGKSNVKGKDWATMRKWSNTACR